MIQRALTLLKTKIGITSDKRDPYLIALIKGVEQEVKRTYGISLDELDPEHIFFIVDFAEYRYRNVENKSMPRDIQFRLHNLMTQGERVGGLGE